MRPGPGPGGTHSSSLFVTITFLILVLFGIPLVFSLRVSALTDLWMAGIGVLVFTPRLMNAVNSVLLISIPLFMMAGELMLMGGIIVRLVDF